MVSVCLYSLRNWECTWKAILWIFALALHDFLLLVSSGDRCIGCGTERSKCLRCEIMSSKEHYRAAAHFFTKVFSFSKTKRHEYWEDAPLIRQHGPMWSWLSCLVRRSFIISLVLTGSTDACLIITSRHASLGVRLVSVRPSVRPSVCVCLLCARRRNSRLSTSSFS